MIQAAESSWWSRNWKWFVPLGASALVAVTCALVLLIFSLLKSSDVYRMALATAKASPVAGEQLGTPIAEGYFTSGNISVSGPTGSAQLAIPVSGPKAAGTVFLEARKSMGKWVLLQLELELEATRQRVDLLTPAGAREEPAPARAARGEGVASGPKAPSETQPALDGGDAAAAAKFVGARKSAAPRVAALLADLGQRLPAGSVLERLEIDEKDRIELRATTPDVSKLVDSLSKSDRFAAASVEASEIPDAHALRPEFDVVAQLNHPAVPAAPVQLLRAYDRDAGFSEIADRLKQALDVLPKTGERCGTLNRSPERDSEEEPYQRVIVRVRMHCADTPLVALLSDLEDGSPTLFVSKFSFYRISEYAPPGAGTAPKTLDITFNLSGYVTPSAAER